MLVTHNEETKEYLLEMINDKRETMLMTAARFGLDSEKTLECSQKLDELIVQHQRMTPSGKQSTT
ncbi:Spo0E family sporulation regulatory protein-aspartic acid phosphatase [Oceanobacillus longus]|uniref:Spo0E family sporulation regulatory protein-aspartic acid phosphatase n=1 Tax=Oceanobacillus longus TaxID=930120 RepID=A0ABV8H1Z6_9BACI